MSNIIIVPRLQADSHHLSSDSYSHKPYKVKVNGHRVRTQILIDELNTLGADCCIGMENISEKTEVIVMDGKYIEILPEGCKHVFIDSGDACYYRCDANINELDLYINPDIGVRINRKVHAKSYMLGVQFSILSKLCFMLQHRSYYHEYDHQFFIAPGGMKDRFYKKCTIVPNTAFVSDGNLNHTENLREMWNSQIVITTPSQTALEAMAMGKPVYLIQTSNDQSEISRHAIDNNIARKFNGIENALAEHELHIQMGLNARKYMSVARFGTETVANAIINLLE